MAYGYFLVVYVAAWLVLMLTMGALHHPWPAQVSGMDLLILSLATFRLTEIISEEKIARCLRAPFCQPRTVTGPNGKVSEEEVPTGTGLRRMVGELILCPWCAGVWIATLVTFFWLLAPAFARVVMLAFGVAAGGVLFQIAAKLMDRTRKAIPEE